MIRFSAEEAFDASDDGDPIELTYKQASVIVASHGFTMDELGIAERQTYDAALVLRELGY